MSLQSGWMWCNKFQVFCFSRRRSRGGSIVLAALLAIFVPSLANAYCGVRIQGKWQYSGGSCKDWNDYAKYSGDSGFACFDFGTVAMGGNGTLLRNSATDVRLVKSSGEQLPLSSDAMQRAFDSVARQALAARPLKRIVIVDDQGVISDARLAQISRETGVKIETAGNGAAQHTKHH